MTWEDWLAVIGGATGVVGVLAALWAVRRVRAVPRPPHAQVRSLKAEGRRRVAFVVNPGKAGQGFRELAERLCHDYDYEVPDWYETTVEHAGAAQADEAIRAGAGLVVAVGGDGTVRAVADAVAGRGLPMGIVPLGTANLLARNLGLPLLGADQALRVALGGATRTIDVGRLSAYSRGGQIVVDDEVFLVIAGLGFDAEVVRDADADLKRRLGWPAYFVSGMSHLSDRRIAVRVRADGVERSVKARSVMIGNCGRLPAGVHLLPDAVVDDQLLDVALVDVRNGLVGWAALVTQVVLHPFGVRSLPSFASGHLYHRQCRNVQIICESPQRVQLDGEAAGQALILTARVDPGCLQVRVRP